MMTAVMDAQRARHYALEQQFRPWMPVSQAQADAFLSTPREAFLPAEAQHRAYSDIDDLPLGAGQTALSPKVQMRLIADLQLKPSDHVLQIGAGTGYMTALMAKMAAKVTAYECESELAQTARIHLLQARIENAQVLAADVRQSTVSGQFDAIVFCGAVGAVPTEWLARLKPGGRLAAIVGQAPMMRAHLHQREGDAQPTCKQGWDTLAPYLQGFAPVAAFSL